MPQINRNIIFISLVLSMLFAAGGMAEEVLRCARCNDVIRSSYYRTGGNPYCSKKCLIESLPQCDECGKRLTEDHLVWQNHRYCSQSCLEKALPKCEICGSSLRTAHIINGHAYCEQDARRPKCDKCGLPFVRGFELGDGRTVCSSCDSSLLYHARDAQPYYLGTRAEVARVTGMTSPSLPKLHLVGLDDLKAKGRQVSGNGIRQRGLYDRKVMIETTKNAFGQVVKRTEHVTENIYILYGLSPGEFTATAAHELMHDLLAERFPELAASAPSWTEEGLCQYVAAAVSHRLQNEKALAQIEANTDPDYGDGYQWLKEKFGFDNWPDVQKWLESIDPKKLPKQL